MSTEAIPLGNCYETKMDDQKWERKNIVFPEIRNYLGLGMNMKDDDKCVTCGKTWTFNFIPGFELPNKYACSQKETSMHLSSYYQCTRCRILTLQTEVQQIFFFLLLTVV
jgi:ferredoxin